MCRSTIAKPSFPASPFEAAQLPASAGAGQPRKGAWVPGPSLAIVDLPEPSLTYGEIGQALCECVDAHIINAVQARLIGYILFPSKE